MVKYLPKCGNLIGEIYVTQTGLKYTADFIVQLFDVLAALNAIRLCGFVQCTVNLYICVLDFYGILKFLSPANTLWSVQICKMKELCNDCN